MKKNITFFINPISGGKTKLNFPEMADKFIDPAKFCPTYIFTEAAGHAHQLAKEMVEGDTNILVAVGGDGTINEIASAVEGSGKIIGIIPYGSGNGLARSLGIPLNDKQAVQRLNKLNVNRIDSGTFNGRSFFNMAGIGFDAHISAVFASNVKRGLGGYVKTAITEITNYQCQHYILEIDGKRINRDAFMISIANSSQFGNNAHISPFASLKDGLLDVCITKPFPLYQFPVLGYRMFSRSTHKSKYVEIIKGKKIRIVREGRGTIHLDGEPCDMASELQIEIKPLSLSVLT
ncbi:MAG: diacylglycerol/lipid kinase family protein [Daejeonella sp.]|uniref:diacylglycerol/lipid kinase family protein n=1 Tax=Daejeonella sp. JGW-45 TaxID=3034148 RepID=UPI0023ED59DF|nr:diacylglycerol kinase family protein [Daejeonella sp. JGW-45]